MNVDRIMLDSLLEDLQECKSSKARKELYAEIQELRARTRKAILIKLGIVAFIILILVNAISTQTGIETDTYKNRTVVYSSN